MKIIAIISFVFFISLSCFSQKFSRGSLLIISLRKDFQDSKKLSEEPQARWIGFNPRTFFELKDDVEETALINAVKGKNVLILIHGMGLKFSRVVSYYGRLLNLMENGNLPYDLVIGIAWPGYEIKKSLLHNGIIFLKANGKAKKSGKKLSGLLERIAAEAGSLEIFTHSLGAKVAMAALKNQQEKVDNLFLTGPAIAAKSFQGTKRYGFIGRQVTKKIVVFYSRQDPAFRGPGKWKMGRRGMIGDELPIGGKFINVDCTHLLRRHSEYWYSYRVLELITGFTMENH